jgi:hypothetical protein
MRWLAPGRIGGSIASAGNPLSSPFAIVLAHPTMPGRDLRLLVRPDRDGRFVIGLPALERTHWQVVAEGAARDWRLAKAWDGRQPLAIDADPP